MKVAFIGWRGMVGSVLLERIFNQGDYKEYDLDLFSTSQAGKEGLPVNNHQFGPLKDAYDLETLKNYDVILTTQGSGYTEKIYPRIMKENWKGYWVDAASLLRMDKNSIICLDPVNVGIIKDGLTSGVKTLLAEIAPFP